MISERSKRRFLSLVFILKCVSKKLLIRNVVMLKKRGGWFKTEVTGHCLTNAETTLYQSGLEINEKIQSQFCDKIRKLKRNFAKFRRKIVALHCVVSGVAKYEPTILVLKETAENGE